MKDFFVAPLAGLWRVLTAPAPQIGEWYELDCRWLTNYPRPGPVRVTILHPGDVIGYSHRNSPHSYLETTWWHFHMLYRKIK